MKLSEPVPPLTDGVVRLRRWRLADSECVRQASADPRIPAMTTVPSVFTPDAGRAFIERQWSRARRGEGVALAIARARDDLAVGHVYLAVRDQSGVIGLGYWVLPAARGQGVGHRAVELASAWAFTSLRAARIEAWVEPDNAPSQRTLVSAGFTREGVLRSFLLLGGERSDAVVFSRLAGEG